MLAAHPHFAGEATDEELLRLLQLAVDFASAIKTADGFDAGPTPERRVIFRDGHGRDFSRLAAVAILLRRFAMPQFGTLVVEGLNQRLPQLRFQRFLIPFDHQDVVRFLGEDFSRRFNLAMHGVGRDDRALQIEYVDQLLHGGDFVRFILDRLESKAHLQTARPSGNGMQRRSVRRFVERTAERLAVEGHRFAAQRLSDIPRP